MTRHDDDRAMLVVNILDYWLPGSGQAAGTHLDEVADRELGLPYLGGKHLKGLLRNAVRCAESWGQVTSGSASALFGKGGASEPALLRLDNARLPTEVRNHCRVHPEARDAFFREISATAMGATGTAKPRSLRTVEVCVPLRLEAGITRVGVAETSHWFEILARCAPLVDAVGKRRGRGFGRAELSLKRLDGGSGVETRG